jgi:hypothetical protein
MPRLAFTEYDAYAETVRNVSVSMRMCSRQVSKWTPQFAAVGSLAVQNGFVGGGSIAEGVNGSDAWSFYFQSRPGRANGHDLNEDEVFAVPPGGEFCLGCKPSHEWISVHIPPSLLFPPALESEFASSSCTKPGNYFEGTARTAQPSPGLPSTSDSGISADSPADITRCSENILPRPFARKMPGCGGSGRRSIQPKLRSTPV